MKALAAKLVTLALLAACHPQPGAVPPAGSSALVAAPAVTLQSAYNKGRTIDGAAGPVEVAGDGIKSPTLYNDAKLAIVAVGELVLDGDASARLNSKNGSTEIVGRDVSILAQGDGGGISLDAVDEVDVRGTARFKSGVVTLKGLTVDPSPLEAGQIWYRKDLKALRYYDGTAVRTLNAP